MNASPYPMTTKLADDTVTRTDYAPLYCSTDVNHPSAGLRSGDPFIQGLNRGIQQLLELRRSAADNHRHSNVADETLMPNTNIDLEQIPKLQPPCVPNAMNDSLIH
jgi:hypothetical protein